MPRWSIPAAFVKISILRVRPVHLTRLRRPLRPTRYPIQKSRANTIPRKVRNVLIHKKGNV
jgi:hypothetical protein